MWWKSEIVLYGYRQIHCMHKTDDVYKDVETRFDTSNLELGRPLPKKKNIVGIMKDQLGRTVMTKFVVLRAKTYSYLIDGHSEDKKLKVTKMCVIKRKHKFENYKNCLEATQLENKINYLEKNKIDKESIKKNCEEFVRNHKSILKTQQRFKS